MPSSVVADFSYDAAHSMLRVVYRSGTVYEYRSVPESIYNAMKAAVSKGTFLNKNIKGIYKYRKVS